MLRVVPGQEANIDADHGTTNARSELDRDEDDMGEGTQVLSKASGRPENG